MTTLKPGTKVIISEDTIECTKHEAFLNGLIGKTLEITEVTNEYKDEKLPTYKCKYEDGLIVTEDGSNYFPFVDADLKIYTSANDKIITKEDVIKNDIMHNIFNLDEEYGIVVPTFKELVAAKEILPEWQLSEEYGDYPFDSIVNIINERYSDFLETLYTLDAFNKNEKKKKKYGYRTYVEYGTPLEIIEVLQELHDWNDDVEDKDKFILLQASVKKEDFSTIQVLLGIEIGYAKLEAYLKDELDVEFHDEVAKLIEAIKEAKADNHDTLHLYDC